MNFLVLGRGKTGALVAEIAKERGHEVRSLASQENQDGRALTPATLKEIDAAIDFTTPHAVIPNIRVNIFQCGPPTVHQDITPKTTAAVIHQRQAIGGGP